MPKLDSTIVIQVIFTPYWMSITNVVGYDNMHFIIFLTGMIPYKAVQEKKTAPPLHCSLKYCLRIIHFFWEAEKCHFLIIVICLLFL